jgi:hypothetical protein
MGINDASGQTLPEFKRSAVKPVECLKDGWELIKDQYWLFVGMSVVGLLMGSAAMGLLTGPIMCGIYIALFRQHARERVEFATLFKGLDYFADAVIAWLLHAVPVALVVGPLYLIYFAMVITQMMARRRGDPSIVLGYLAAIGICMPLIIILLAIISIIFVFAYPLIVDRGLSGMKAVKLSYKAGMANFWSLFGLLLLNGLLGTAGGFICGVGFYFVLPVTYASLFVAYLQVFGATKRPPPRTPPPPPAFASLESGG